ncbi:hypothetical protein [Caldimonas brevitalea]|uniref:Uncharacterized protein n=1 Tax=Caldimonas brevitalea TaxID=413882 RepID=A0A0G3BHF0_9BURK|nr:hypothetical protein [Caldimonas brevitalea]AKJ28859.1 hypothetical protein AAW51_2168 [Caldimonas brevitalea]
MKRRVWGCSAALLVVTWLGVGIEHDLPGDHEDQDAYMLFLKAEPTLKLLFVNPFTRGDAPSDPRRLTGAQQEDFLLYCRHRLGMRWPTLHACFDAYKRPICERFPTADPCLGER